MKRRRSVLFFAWIVPVSVFCFGIIPPSVFAADDADVYGLVESFTWREFDDSGAQSLRESGLLFGIGMSFTHMEESRFTVKLRGELFGGQVDYVGQTQAGVPATTDTNYFGIKGEGDLGQTFMVGAHYSLEPFAGAGLRWWIRDIMSTDTASGATEKWTSLYFRLGLRGDHDFSRETRGFLEASVKLPVYNINALEDSISLRPGNRASLYAEAGMKVDRLRVSAFYEGLRFSKSNVVTTIAPPFVIYTWQPESKADIYGITVGTVF